MSCLTPSSRHASRLNRRQLLLGSLVAALHGGAAAADEQTAALLRQGGVVVVMRHALAPGTFDPPTFKLGDCSTQRLLSEEGRAQSRRVGEWFASRQLKPAQVRSSPWCRCIDTASLAFGRPQSWTALGSPHGRSGSDQTSAQQALREALASLPADGFEVWVTHNFVIDALLGVSGASGEAFVVRNGAGGKPEVLARLNI